MLILICCALFLIIGIILLIIVFNSYWERPVILTIGTLSTLVGFVSLVVLSIICIVTQSTKQLKYKQVLQEKEIIESRLEKPTNDILLTKDIIKFNNKIMTVRYYSNSLWTNWFNNGLIAKIELIEMGGN